MDIKKKGLSDQIAITWACAPTFHTTDPKIGFSMALKVLRKVRLVSDDYIFYPEIGDSGSNIHFHGMIILKDKVKWFKSVLPTLKRNGFVKITKMNEGWYDYIKKDWEIMKQILDLEIPINNEFMNGFGKIKLSKNISRSQNIVDLMYGGNYDHIETNE